MLANSLEQQLEFLRAIDALKGVVRQSPLLDGSRKENSAEHSWHLAMYALVLQHYGAGTVDLGRVVVMLLLHDIVEVDVGDMPIHSSDTGKDQAELEAAAALRLFGILPEAQFSHFLALWSEFEANETDDARFAKALDRLQPLLANVWTGGGTWTESKVSIDDVRLRYGPTIRKGSPALWRYCEQLIDTHFAIE